MRVAAPFKLAVDLALALGAERICELPGCWEHQVDEQWWIAMNGHREETPCTHGPTVLPFHIYVEFNGWPAGFVAHDGGCLAAGLFANEDSLIDALEAALRRVA